MEWNRPPYKGPDIEAGGGARPLYPSMLESPEIRWAFIRKIYSILSIQMLLTIAVSAVVIFVRPISHFFVSSGAGLGLYIFLIILPFLGTLSCITFFVCSFSLILFVVFFFGSFSLFFCFWRVVPSIFLPPAPSIKSVSARPFHCIHQLRGKVILEAAILTAVVVVSLTLYTFWAAKRGHDFSFLGPILFSSLIVLIVFAFIQIFFPMGRISHMIYGGLAALIFSGYIIYDTDNLIKRYAYDEYIWAAVALYLDIINLFLSLLTLFRAADG
ncbi:hypothetical protein IEQ34_006737 [Dendrobium chrysotoxum]|uniref:BI1-like protein n=1 Tax=Dendrobium chrysotoxum TaxID=161865 RepID=A0AAV7H4H4_DENCH|nr:hypothetical protein IEQ34_006737 [Dendrobium chrysotoxum]